MKTKIDVVATHLELIRQGAELIKQYDRKNAILRELADNIIESSAISLKLLQDKRDLYIPGQGDTPDPQD